MPYHIYRLRDPRTSEVRYIGVTCHPTSRYNAHLKTIGNGVQEKWEWIQELQAENCQPVMEIFESHQDRDMGYVRERYWITKYFEQGANLFNAMGIIAPITIEKVSYLLKDSQYYSSPSGVDALILRRRGKQAQIVVYSIRKEQVQCKIVNAVNSLRPRQEDSAIDEVLQLVVQRELEMKFARRRKIFGSFVVHI